MQTVRHSKDYSAKCWKILNYISIYLGGLQFVVSSKRTTQWLPFSTNWCHNELWAPNIPLFFPITWTQCSFETEELYTVHFNFRNTQNTIVSAEGSTDSTEQWWNKYLRFVNHVWVGGGAGFLTVLQVKRRVSRLPPGQSKTCYLFVILDHHNSSVTPVLDSNCRRVWCFLKRSGNVRQRVIGLFLCYVWKQTRNINEVRNNLRIT